MFARLALPLAPAWLCRLLAAYRRFYQDRIFPELLHEAAEADSDFVGLYLRNDMLQYVPSLLFRSNGS